MSGKGSSEFQWIDDKIQLLLEATQNLNVEKAYQWYNWEAKRNKYDWIRELITEIYPKDSDSEKYSNCNIIEDAKKAKEYLPNLKRFDRSLKNL